MLPDNLVGSVRNKYEKPLEIKPEKPVATKEPALNSPASTSNLNEKNFTADLQRNLLFRKFEPATFKPTETPAAPIDYFEVDKQADELIKKYTEDGFLWTEPLNTDGLGKELSDIAKTDPDRAAALTDNILDKIDGGDKDELAQSFTESLSPSELREFAKTDRGKELLGKLRQHLEDGVTWDDEDATIDRIDTAVKAADYEKSAEFKALSPEAQKEVLSHLDSYQGNNKATDNLITLAKNGDFAKLPVETQREMLKAFDNNKEDSVFTQGLITTAGKPEFQALNPAQQSQVLGTLDKLADTESYKSGGGEDDAGRAYLLDHVGDMAMLSAQDPGNAAISNTLNKVLSGEVKYEFFSQPSDPKTGGTLFGTNSGNGVLRINIHPDANNDAVWGANKFTDTTVHELNHQQNQGAEHGTPEQFLNEYRAFYVGVDAIDGAGAPDAATQKGFIDNLLASYPDIKELYDNNADFKKFVDNAKAGLDKTPPETLDPEQMRQALLDAGFDDDYLKKTGNLDNH